MQQKIIPICGMHCHSCELLLEDAIGKIQGVTKVKINFRKGRAIVEHGNDIPSQNEIINAFCKEYCLFFNVLRSVLINKNNMNK